MNALRNKVQLIGRLGQDPDIRMLDSGKKVAHFNIATNGSYRNAEGNRIDETTWHSIVAWNGLAELCSKYLKRGREVCIEGRISYRVYTDKNGLQKNVTEVVASDMVFLGPGGRESELSDGNASGLDAEDQNQTGDVSFTEKSVAQGPKAKGARQSA
jgi:single-strand DNA-binding protein